VERRLVDEVLRSGHLSCGPVLETFEREFAARFGARHAVAVSSGTAALHVAMIAAGVGEGDVVVTTPFSFIASANAILFQRATPHFVDIDPDTLNIDPAATVDAIERLAPRAVLPVHIFGRPAEMRDIVHAAREHGVAVVEDACEAVGASADGVPAGRWGDAAAFGFYPNKQLTTGEGGVLLTDRDDWARLARSLRNQGRTEANAMQHDRLGYNYRLDDLSAAVGLGQLRRLDELLQKRATVAARYDALLRGVDGVTMPAPARPGMRISWFVYIVRLAPEIDRERVMAALAARGIDSRPYFPPIHLQPLYRQQFGFRPGAFPHAEAAGRELLALPFHGNLGDDDVEWVCASLAEEVSAVRA
jgi:perosamine synthetase